MNCCPGSTAPRPWSKRWLPGTHHGSVAEAHLQSYLNEFTFRFNRRGSRSRGLVFYRVLELAVAHDPVRYRELVAGPRPKATPPKPPGIDRATRRAWTAHQRPGPGEHPDLGKSGQLDGFLQALSCPRAEAGAAWGARGIPAIRD